MKPVAPWLAALFLLAQAGCTWALLANTRRSNDERVLVACFIAVDVVLAGALLLRWRRAPLALALRSLLGLLIFGGFRFCGTSPWAPAW